LVPRQPSQRRPDGDVSPTPEAQLVILRRHRTEGALQLPAGAGVTRYSPWPIYQ